MMEFSDAARDKLTEPWEERILYVYDDKRKKERVNGKLQYPEWDGGVVRGTLTIGIGHTDAAGPMPAPLPPKIVKGLRITHDQADEILSRDLEPCVRRVNALLKVKVTQHQFDALVDTYFNCPSAAVAAIKLINAGHIDQVPGKLLQYVNSKGERMEGLVNRRSAEIRWMHTPDDRETPGAPPADVPECPKGERNPQPKPSLSSKVVNAGAAIATGGGGGVIATIQKAHEAAAPLKDIKQDLSDFGIIDQLGSLVHSPMAIGIASGIMGAFGLFVIYDRITKLRNDHV